MTMSLTATLGAIGLVVDIGWSYWRKEAATTAAKSAATAAMMAASSAANQSCGAGTTHWNCSSSYSCPASPSPGSIASNLDNGCLYAQKNGFLNTGNQTVTMSAGTGTPPTAPGTTSSYYVIANVSENIPTLFSAILGQQWMQAKSQATASIVAPTAGGACIYVVSTNAAKAFNFTGGSFTSGCGIDIDSTASNALDVTATGMSLTGGAGISVAGQAVGSSSISFSGGGSVQINQVVPGDPFAGKLGTPPTPAGTCTPDPNYASGMNNITIPQGTYCKLTVSGGTNIVLSGIYIITAGKFNFSSGSVSTATGGALLYFPSTNLSGGLSLTAGSGSSITLNGLTQTTYNGFAVWQDNNQQATITNSGGTTAINGIIYTPNSVLNYTAGSTAVSQTIVTKTFNVTGGALAHPGVSSLYSAAGTPGGNFIVQ